MSLQTLTATNIEAVYEALSADGAVVVQGVFPTQNIDRVSADIVRALEAVPWCNTAEEVYGADFFGRKSKRLHGVLQYSPAIEGCLMHSTVLGLAEHWLGHKPHFSTGEVMAIGPGECQQNLHLDGDSWRRANLPGELLFSMTMALTDFSAANGATVVAPGSRTWPEGREPAAEDFTAAEMEKGSVLFYSGNLLHGGGANQTETTRVGLYLGYIPFWLQPLENSVSTHPDGFLQSLEPATQAFLDYHPSGFNALLG